MDEFGVIKLLIDSSAGAVTLFIAYKIFQMFAKHIGKQENMNTAVVERMLGIMADLVDKIDGSLRALKDLVAVSTEVNKEISTNIKEFRDSVSGRFDEVDVRFNTVDEKLDHLDARVKTLEGIERP